MLDDAFFACKALNITSQYAKYIKKGEKVMKDKMFGILQRVGDLLCFQLLFYQ